MKLFQWMAAALLLGTFSLKAEVPELLKLVPEAKGYELIAKLNPLQWRSNGYTVDNSDAISGDLKRVGYLLTLTGKDGKTSWVFTAMDPFAKEAGLVTVPTVGSKEFQCYVNNLEVAGNVPGLKTGKFDKGNIEFWGSNYGGNNAQKIPGATGAFDFGDQIARDGGYGSMQVHNYLEKQTVFSFSNLNANTNCDLGIGNNPKGQPDWTFSKAGQNYKTAELYIVGKFDNFKVKKITRLNTKGVQLVGTTDRDPVTYAVNDPMIFTLTADIGNQKPDVDYYIAWTRTGDDGKTVTGKSKLTDGPVKIKTSIDRPGFVRIQGQLVDKNGKTLEQTLQRWGRSYQQPVTFEGGAGADIAKIKQAIPEPKDFDQFWQKQKARLAKVPMKYTMDKVSTKDGINVYAVKIDCAGPRPVTGYLTIPVGAKPKSLPARVVYFGYSTGKQGIPHGRKNEIEFQVNAHGFDLGKDDAYYKKFDQSIRSNGQIYAFDPKQNSDPETAYFNGMALRLIRSLEFVKQLPQWDGKNLIACGGSQGGLQTIWAGGLDQDVTRCEAAITWCCDLDGYKAAKRLKGWRPDWVPALGYYDAVNHAKRIKCPVFITRAGLGDYTCPPSGLAILYNVITTPVQIFWYQGSTHGYVPPKPEKFVHSKK